MSNEKSLSEKIDKVHKGDMSKQGIIWSGYVREAVLDVIKELEKSIIEGNKLNYPRTISTIKRKFGKKLT